MFPVINIMPLLLFRLGSRRATNRRLGATRPAVDYACQAFPPRQSITAPARYRLFVRI